MKNYQITSISRIGIFVILGITMVIACVPDSSVSTSSQPPLVDETVMPTPSATATAVSVPTSTITPTIDPCPTTLQFPMEIHFESNEAIDELDFSEFDFDPVAYSQIEIVRIWLDYEDRLKTDVLIHVRNLPESCEPNDFIERLDAYLVEIDFSGEYTDNGSKLPLLSHDEGWSFNTGTSKVSGSPIGSQRGLFLLEVVESDLNAVSEVVIAAVIEIRIRLPVVEACVPDHDWYSCNYIELGSDPDMQCFYVDCVDSCGNSLPDRQVECWQIGPG